ncbi:MAG TPA: hypothetical protein DHU55_08105 [Blastocatellia bacterium]|jgi:pyrroloquinoline quinone (PQQ) biosynthesis protein C|nr:hypothetical protein [Blastocatellia bacterium]
MERKFPLGTKLSEQKAKRYVDELAQSMLRRSEQKVLNGRFMTALSSGELPREGLRVFWLNWHGFVAEINNFIQCAYQRHLGFFKKHPLLYGAFADKVADELIHPKPPGHILVVWEQGEIFGLTKDEMVDYEMLPKCRALIEWHRSMLYEGTMVEFWSSILWEEAVGHWAKQFREGLTKYGHGTEEAPYFTTHEEADLEVHEGGVMAHGEFNKAVLSTLLQEGYVETRPGYSIVYCTETSLDLFAHFLDTCYEAVALESKAKAV